MTDNRFTSVKILIKNTVINFIGMVVPLGVGVAAIPFAIRGLGKDGFGILSIAWVILSYSVLLDIGLSRATTKFIAEHLHGGEEKIPHIMWTAVFLALFIGAVGGLVLYSASPALVTSILKVPAHLHEEAIKGMRTISLGLPMLLISFSLKGMLAAVQRFDLINLVQIPANTLNFLFPALSLFLGISLSTVLLLIVINRIMASGVYLLLCLKTFPECRAVPKSQNRALIGQMLIFGGWVTVTGIVSPILVYIDRFFVGSMLNVGMLTFYAAPLEAVSRFRVIPAALMNTLFPEFSKSRAKTSHEHYIKLISKSLNMILLSTGLLSAVLFFFAKDILMLWLGDDFVLNSTTILRLVSVSILFNFLALVPFTYLIGSGRPDIPAKCHLIELPLYLALSWICIQKFGITGAALAWSLRVTGDALLLFILTFRRLPGLFTALMSAVLLRIASLLCAYAFFLFLITRFVTDLWPKLILLLVLSITAGIITYHQIFNQEDRDNLLQLFAKRPA